MVLGFIRDQRNLEERRAGIQKNLFDKMISLLPKDKSYGSLKGSIDDLDIVLTGHMSTNKSWPVSSNLSRDDLILTISSTQRRNLVELEPMKNFSSPDWKVLKIEYHFDSYSKDNSINIENTRGTTTLSPANEYKEKYWEFMEDLSNNFKMVEAVFSSVTPQA